MSDNIFKHTYQVSKEDRLKSNGHNSFLIWFTGLSGSGKSTIASTLEKTLFDRGIRVFSLDGDNVRKGLNSDLGFSDKDRTENIRRIAEVAKLFIDAGTVVLGAFVSPFKKDRENIREVVEDINFVEIFVDTSLEECERRDVKGLYKKARTGEIKNMTGISSPYEEPENPDILIRTEDLTVEESVKRIISAVEEKLKINL